MSDPATANVTSAQGGVDSSTAGGGSLSEVNGDVGAGAGINVKEIEVTAKQIVDRISSKTNLKEGNRPSPRNSTSSKDGDIPPTSSTNEAESASNTETGKRNSVTKPMMSRHLSMGNNPAPGTPPLLEGQVSAEQKAVEQLLKAVEKWVQEAQSESESGSVRSIGVKELDNLHWVYSIESYLRSLDTDWTSQKALTHKIASQLNMWFKQLFHFSEKDKGEEYNSIHPHWDINGGLSAVTQMSLYLKFPNLYSLGYQHFQEEGKTPMIYCSDEMIGQQICSKIGLPYNCVSVVDFTDKLWVEQLETRLRSDIELGRVPVALLMNTAVQNLERGVKLAESYKIWVHFYGNNVLAYFLKRSESTSLGSSFTLDLTRWLKNPKLPYLTLYKRPDKIEPRILELCELGSPRSEIMCFTPWFVAHVFGKTRLIALVNESIARGKFLLEMVRRFEALVVVPNWSTLSDGSVILSTLTFQFNPSSGEKSPSRKPSTVAATASGSSASQSPDVQHSSQYLDTLNSWLYHIMERDLKETLPLEFVFVETRGWNIHIDVIRTPAMTPEDEASIVSAFQNHMHVLAATVNQKIKFQKLVEESQEMIWINNENHWAGLGAVRYIPSAQRINQNEGEVPPGTEQLQNGQVPSTPASKKVARGGASDPDKAKEEIDHLNAQIVNKLRAIDSAFSLGECSATGEWCVQFGMVTEETDVQELVRLVAATGQEIEESSEFFNRMSELVKKGIHEAEEELRKESDEALWEEGILRRVPIVGTFVSWFSPPTKETGVRGRALNLTQGKVESTENIYKYHMQVKGATTFNVNSKTQLQQQLEETKK